MVFGGQAGPPRGSRKLDLQPEPLGRASQGDLPVAGTSPSYPCELEALSPEAGL